jgi:hypothetical protein
MVTLQIVAVSAAVVIPASVVSATSGVRCHWPLLFFQQTPVCFSDDLSFSDGLSFSDDLSLNDLLSLFPFSSRFRFLLLFDTMLVLIEAPG